MFVIVASVAVTAWWWQSVPPLPPPKPKLFKPYAAWSPGAWGRDDNLLPVPRDAKSLEPAQRVLPSDFQCTPQLELALREVFAATNVRGFIDWRALNFAGYERDKRIDVNIGGKRVGDAISEILVAADDDRRLMCFTIDDGKVFVSTTELADIRVAKRSFAYDGIVQLGKPDASFLGTLGTKTYLELDAAIRAAVDSKSWGQPPSERRLNRRFADVTMTWSDVEVFQSPEHLLLIEYQFKWLRWRGLAMRFCARTGVVAGVSFGSIVLLQSLLHWRRRILLARIGHCRKCGYDLRATPQRCPECGTMVPAVLAK
jgi:hypothetical protein